MSSFVVSPEHIKVLAIFAASQPEGVSGMDIRVNPRHFAELESTPEHLVLDREHMANLYARILYDENLRSVRFLYGELDIEDLPGLIHKPEVITITQEECYLSTMHRSSIEILKWANCLEYQSCDCPDYKQTLASRLLDQIRHSAILELPGYEDVPWEYYEKSVS